MCSHLPTATILPCAKNARLSCVTFHNLVKAILRLTRREVTCDAVAWVIIRFVVSTLVLIVVSWLSPGFVVSGGCRSADCRCCDSRPGICGRGPLGERISLRAGAGGIRYGGGGYLPGLVIPSLLSVSIVGALISHLLSA